MTPQLPSFLRRRLRLSDARKALLGGRPERALACLCDPCLDGSEEARSLRERVLDLLCREAAKCDARGARAEGQRLLALVELHDAARAGTWRRRLCGSSHESWGGTSAELRRESQAGVIQALEQLLAEMRDERTHSDVLRNSPAKAESSSADSRAAALRAGAHDSAEERPGRGARERRFRLAVDDIGEFLVVHSARVTIGHAHAGLADLPVAADVDPEHARLIRTESFHAGPGWRIEALREQRIAIDGHELDAGGGALLDGDEVRLARNLAFVFRRPEAASGSALLEFLHGAECAGTRRVLLLAPGPAGRLRLGSTSGRHLVSRRLEHDVTLWIDGDELVVECAGSLRAEHDVEVTIQGPGASGPGGLRVVCPPLRRQGFVVGRGGPEGPPFGFSIAPAPRGSSAECEG
jgi:hypothetical protein